MPHASKRFVGQLEIKLQSAQRSEGPPAEGPGPSHRYRPDLCFSLRSVPTVTIDKSLKVRRGSLSNRNVLTRVERVAKLQEAERWKEGDNVLGMPKVRVQKLSLKKKKKTKKEEDGK